MAPGSATRIVNTLIGMGPTTPPTYKEELFSTLAMLLYAAELPRDGGKSWANYLAKELKEATSGRQRTYLADRIAVSIAKFIPKVSPRIGMRLRRSIYREARKGHWEGVHQLAAQGSAISRQLLNKFLSAETAVARRLSTPVDGTSFPVRFRPMFFLGQAAAKGAGRRPREEALDAALSVLQQERQWTRIKEQWIPFTIYLLLADPFRISEAVPILAKLAKGQFTEPGRAGILPTHTLSTMRFLGPRDDIRSSALIALGALYGLASESERQTIDRTIRKSFRNRRVAARVAAVDALSQLLQSIRALEESEARPEQSMKRVPASDLETEMRELLVNAVVDPAPSVQEAAIRVLRDERAW